MAQEIKSVEKSVKKIVDDLLVKIEEGFVYGYSRWQDEKDFEDINDYAVLFEKAIKDAGVSLVKMTRRPFGFVASVLGIKFQFYCNGREIGYKAIGQ